MKGAPVTDDPRPRLRIAYADLWQRAERGFLPGLLAKRYRLTVSDEPEVVFASVFGEQFRRFDCARLIFIGEPRQPNPRHHDLSLSFGPTTDANYHLPLYRFYVDRASALPPSDPAAEMATKSGFCSFVTSNRRFGPRHRFVQLLHERRPVASGGAVFNNTGGPVTDKRSFLSRFRFHVCLENTSMPGYLTEKLVHARQARTVPIYWGDPGVAEVFNPRAFINAHRFADLEELAEHVIELDDDPDAIVAYLSEPLFAGPVPPPPAEDPALFDWLEPRLAEAIEHPLARTARWRRRAAVLAATSRPRRLGRSLRRRGVAVHFALRTRAGLPSPPVPG